MSPPLPPSRTRGQVFAGALRAETSKLASLPAAWLTLAATLAVTVVFSAAFALNADTTPSSPAALLDYGVIALTWTQCGFFLLGVIAATSEHVGGQIRTTLVAIPHRALQRLAATTALAAPTFAAATLTVAVSITTTLAVTRTPIEQVDLALAARLTLSAAGYLTLMAILSSALGFLVRRAVPTAAMLLVYLLILSPILQDQRWYFLPDIASYTLWFATIPADAPPALTSWLVLTAWTLALLAPSTIAAARRDT